MRLGRDEAWARLTAAPSAVLATVAADGSPHLVPFVFARLDGVRLVSAVDAKPKASRRLRRLEHIRVDPRVTVLADHYEEDWSRLWWVRASGRAVVHESEPAGARALLIERYPPHAAHELGPWIVIEVEDVSGWAAG